MPIRHATWIELFFDLVAVAGVAQLTHVLRGDTDHGGFWMWLLLFVAFWMAWSCMTVYGDIAADRVQLGVMLVGMVCLGVMTAAVPEIDEHARTFAIAYVILRMMAGHVWKRGVVIVDLPTIQLLGGVVPWIVSWWTHDPARYVLWAAGLTMDLLAILSLSAERLMEGAIQRVERRGRGRARSDQPELEGARIDSDHLGERLALFVLIVLGEGVVAVVLASSEPEWNRQLFVTAMSAFALLVGVWAVAVEFGFAGIPSLRPDAVPPRIVMALHLVTSGAVAAVVAAVGLAMDDPTEHMSAGTAVLLGGAVALFSAVAAVAARRSDPGWRWFRSWQIPAAVGAAILAVLGPQLPRGVVLGSVAVVFLVVAAQADRRRRG